MIEVKLSRLVDCVGKYLEDPGQGPTCATVLLPGLTPVAYFCSECADGKCGMGYVQLRNSWLWETWPIPTQNARCNLPPGFTIAVGVLRCMPLGGDRGEPPTADDLNETGLGLLRDRHALWCAINNCSLGEVAVQSWSAIGPQGDCVGGEWIISADLSG